MGGQRVDWPVFGSHARGALRAVDSSELSVAPNHLALGARRLARDVLQTMRPREGGREGGREHVRHVPPIADVTVAW